MRSISKRMIFRKKYEIDRNDMNSINEGNKNEFEVFIYSHFPHLKRNLINI